MKNLFGVLHQQRDDMRELRKKIDSLHGMMIGMITLVEDIDEGFKHALHPERYRAKSPEGGGGPLGPTTPAPLVSERARPEYVPEGWKWNEKLKVWVAPKEWVGNMRVIKEKTNESA